MSNGILRLTLNDPTRSNALSEAMLAALYGAFNSASDNPKVRGIILAAAGPVFCAGHDLKEMTAGRKMRTEGAPISTKFCIMFVTYAENYHLSAVIAEIDGVATAAGCQLVTGYDLAVASKGAPFARPVCILACLFDPNGGSIAIWLTNMSWKCYWLATWCRHRVLRKWGLSTGCTIHRTARREYGIGW